MTVGFLLGWLSARYFPTRFVVWSVQLIFIATTICFVVVGFFYIWVAVEDLVVQTLIYQRLVKYLAFFSAT